jgi:hypothetical protein
MAAVTASYMASNFQTEKSEARYALRRAARSARGKYGGQKQVESCVVGAIVAKGKFCYFDTAVSRSVLEHRVQEILHL